LAKVGNAAWCLGIITDWSQDVLIYLLKVDGPYAAAWQGLGLLDLGVACSAQPRLSTRSSGDDFGVDELCGFFELRIILILDFGLWNGRQ